METKKLLDLLCEALEVDEGTMGPETPIQSVEEWNSVGWLAVIAAIDEQLGVMIPAKVRREMTRVGDLVDYLKTVADVK